MKRKENVLFYEPVAGLTILGAYIEAIKIAKENHKRVHTIVNDIELDVTARTKPERAEALFQKKLAAKTKAEIEAAKRLKKVR